MIPVKSADNTSAQPGPRMRLPVRERAFVPRSELDKARMLRALQHAPLKDDKGRPLIVRVKRLPLKRSLSQNRLYWAWLSILSDHIGCDPADCHYDLKREILGTDQRTNVITGEIEERERSTAGLDTVSFSEYLDKVAQLAASHFGVYLPLPNDPSAWEVLQQAYAKVEHLARAA